MPSQSIERFVVHFCLTEPHEQIVSITTRLDDPFELALWQLQSDKVDNVLVGRLTEENDQLNLHIQGNLHFSAIAYRKTNVQLDTAFSIPSECVPNAVVVTRPRDRTLEYQLDENYVSVPSERASLATKVARQYLVTARTEMLKTRKARLEKELAEIDGKLGSEKTT